MEGIEVPGGRTLLPRTAAELWDLAEDVGRLLESSDDLDLTPACCDLLLALDEAITVVVREPR
ncbi:MAG TPA: hypothetical protein VFK17_00175 [Gaiellaceae bacterium]|nr:hypothetical protein [Gaiellaceae bacterium]